MPRKLARRLVVLGGLAIGRAAADLRRASRSPPAPPTSPTRSSQGIERDPGLARERPAQRERLPDQRARSARCRTPIADSTAEGGVLDAHRRGRHRPGPRRRGVLHRAVLDLLLPRRRQPDLGLDGPAGPARRPRAEVDSSGQVAWRSLTQFVRATVLVAAVDAIGIMIVAAILGVPFVLAIGVLVFLGAFVPMVGATRRRHRRGAGRAGRPGPVTALLMLGGVILVQQIEGHVLQPFLMGRFVSLHPLGVILAIGCGVLVAGIVGALIAVPLAAAAQRRRPAPRRPHRGGGRRSGARSWRRTSRSERGGPRRPGREGDQR